MVPSLRLALPLIATVAAGCRVTAYFDCQLDQQCGAGGRCEATGYCSFPDGVCGSGWRYDDHAGGGNAGDCVGPYDAPVDGPGALFGPYAYLKASNTGASDLFGYSLALSADGETLAIGSYGEDSGATGIGGVQNDDSASASGAVYVFRRAGGVWTQEVYLKAEAPSAYDQFGWSVALSDDGNTLAVGANLEASSATGIDGVVDELAPGSGAVYVFIRAGSSWAPQAYVKASNTGGNDQFGWSVALASDGNTLAVGAAYEDSAATGIDGDPASNAATSSGAVYVFTRAGSNWSQQAYVKASNTGANDQFGRSIALSGNGNLLAVGADLEDSAATGIDGDQGDTSEEAGAAYLFARVGATWSQAAYVKASDTEQFHEFGFSVGVAADGNTVAVGAIRAGEGGGLTGKAYLFVSSGGTWAQQAEAVASNAEANDDFGFAVALSADGNTLAVGARGEDSAAIGVDGDETDNTEMTSGAVYVFTRAGSVWTQRAYIKASNTQDSDRFGVDVAIAGDASSLAVSSHAEDSAATGVDGDQTSNAATDSGAAYVITGL